MRTVVAALMMLLLSVSVAFAAVGDSWDAYDMYDLSEMPAPWLYEYQIHADGVGSWDGTFNFGLMTPYSDPNAWGPSVGWTYSGIWNKGTCNVCDYVNCLRIDCVKWPTGWAGDAAANAFLGFVAPEAGVYSVKGCFGSYTGGDHGFEIHPFIATESLGIIYSEVVTDDAQRMQFDLSVNMAAGEQMIFSQNIITGLTWCETVGMQLYPMGDAPGLLITQTAVPEPASMMALGAGLMGLLGFAWRRRS